LDDIFVTFNLFMNVKAPPLYFLSFLILLFLVHELHDWSHWLMVRVTCHCWGMRMFDAWDLCGSPSAGQHALISIAGPLVNYVLLWIGWLLLYPDNTTEQASLGCALVFACLPLNNLIAAFTGGGDLTDCIRWLQRHGPYSNRHFASMLGLAIGLVLILPPLLRAFFWLPGYKGKLIAFPLLFLLPGWLDRLWNRQLNHWFIPPGTPQEQAYIRVLAWLILLLIGWFFTRKQLKKLIKELSL
jgi:hypothetical protein